MNHIKNLILILILSATTFSCGDDFLDKNPKDELSSATFWIDENDANAGLVAIYDALNPPKHGNPYRGCASWASMGVLADVTPIGFERQSHRLRPVGDGVHTGTNEYLAVCWRLGFRGVVRANDFLANIDGIEFSGANVDQVKNRMKGEARFLRAMYYYWLIELFGDVPLFTDVPTVEDASTPRSPVADVVALIKDDLSFAVANLPTRADAEVGRATRGAAMALQVKTALYEKDWATAATVSGQIISDGEYSLLPNYEDVININNENNEEIIFSVQHVFMNDAEDGSYVEKMYAHGSAAAGGWSFIQPTLWFVDQFERIIPNPQEGVDFVNESPLNSLGEHSIPNEIYEYFEGRDPRMDHTIIRPGARFLDLNDNDILYPHEFRGPKDALTGLRMRKYVVPGAGTSASWDGPLDYVIFRYADILLCHAEAVAMRDGVGSVSQTVLDNTINAVRARASALLPAYTAGSITMDDIYRERIVELGFEGWTYFDMKRSGQIEIQNGYQVQGLTIATGDEATVGFNPDGIANVRIFDPSMHYVWPIPSTEIERSGNVLTQNPGYPQ
ncbi:RagB/SusD family nutrient uptake outer membrane protein [Reichenbachiella ulvae]|uniref:RagB/SusD family nutrient uptake outer membrane protein n=1 Tax=Reichenbachiella ulvae TaxID=2980104 RepID=A0ABT3CSP6_9BACT|nr:RagB/SusD family nutrient uptake outer membrane protein [Reichenbachiella ulvae]MCV9386669.1 RagB/SusD family nutrient uptake outer membrane protein [Reichenbachiella ulvae]